jgi:aspartyl-tRNA synthetase
MAEENTAPAAGAAAPGAPAEPSKNALKKAQKEKEKVHPSIAPRPRLLLT